MQKHQKSYVVIQSDFSTCSHPKASYEEAERYAERATIATGLKYYIAEIQGYVEASSVSKVRF